MFVYAVNDLLGFDDVAKKRRKTPAFSRNYASFLLIHSVLSKSLSTSYT